MNPELISSIASLWLLALVICCTILLLVFRDPLTRLLSRLTEFTLRRGQTELLWKQRPPEEEEAGQTIAGEAKALPETPIEKTAQEKLAVAAQEKLAAEPTTPRDWEVEMFIAFFRRNIEEAETAFQKLLETVSDPTSRLEKQADYLSLRFEYAGDGAALGKLQELAKHEEVTSYAHRQLGLCYEKVNDFERAVEAFEISAQTSRTEWGRAFSIGKASSCLYKAGKGQEALGKLMREIAGFTEPEAVAHLYESLASLYEVSRDWDLRALALEKAIEIKPNETTLQFHAAYSYGENKLNALSLLHYKTLLRFDPNERMALNNLAVEYERLEMPIRSVSMYKKSFAQKETLAAANLAFRLINAGFLGEAKEILDEAKKQEKIHPNIGKAIAALSEKDKEEQNTEDESLRLATEQQGFTRLFAEAYFIERSDLPTFPGVWRSADGVEMTMTQIGNQIEAHWMRGDDKKYKFVGQVCNRAAKITSERVVEGRTLFAGLLGSGKESHGYVYLSPTGEKMFIMNMKEHKHSFLTLDRIS